MTKDDSKKKTTLKDAHLKPFYILKVGDLVRVKDWDMYNPGDLGVIIGKSDYGVACEVMMATGEKKTMMNFVLERVDKDD